MRAFIVLALVALASAGKVPSGRVKGTYERSDFAAFKAKYNKSFSSVEENMRHENYLKAIAEINSHNAEYDQGKHTWYMGENEFLHWTQEELDNRNGYKQGMVETGSMFVPTGAAPDSINWVEKGAVQHVKNQGACGSCWAFGTVGALEGLGFFTNNVLPDCSEQQLVSCDKADSGCSGGLPDTAYQYIIDNGNSGIDTQASYAYTGRDDSCDTDKTKDEENVCIVISSFQKIQGEDNLKESLATNGPHCIGVNASPWSSYSGGIFDSSSCDPNGLNHAVLAVGYTPEYWLVKNSWGPSWGESGYIKLVMGKNMCGMSNDASRPLM